jgi:hypothetical protein
MVDEEDEYVFPHTVNLAVDALRKSLEARLQALEGTEDVEVVLVEIRRQVAECAVNGDITRAGDLSELALDLVAAREHARRV